MGDAIVAVAGLSSHTTSPIKSCVDCAHKIREIANSASIPWNLHLGIHSGSLVAGTIGTKTVQFDIPNFFVHHSRIWNIWQFDFVAIKFECFFAFFRAFHNDR